MRGRTLPHSRASLKPLKFSVVLGCHLGPELVSVSREFCMKSPLGSWVTIQASCRGSVLFAFDQWVWDGCSSRTREVAVQF